MGEFNLANENNTINYIELPMTDNAATKAFYGQVFGWEFTDWGPGYISFAGAGIDGGLTAWTTPPLPRRAFWSCSMRRIFPPHWPMSRRRAAKF